MAQKHTPATAGIQRRLEKWEIDHLRALCAVQAEEIERLTSELTYAENCARMWQRGHEELAEHLESGAAVGLTSYRPVDGCGRRCRVNTITAHILPASPRPVDRCHDTGRVVIGLAHQRALPPIDSRDALTLQRALLDPRTAQRPGLLGQLFGGIYQWL